MGHHTKNQGFTIVELLIVIVVIAILAAITLVSYNGIIQSAYNTQIKSGVRSYYDAITAYYAVNNKYPQTQPEVNGDRVAMTCLGQGYQNQHCGEVTNVDIYEDSLFNSQMKDFLQSNMSVVSNMALPVPGETYIGAVYGIDTVNPEYSSTGYARVIEYAVNGKNADCGISQAHAYSTSAGATACEIVFEPISF